MVIDKSTTAYQNMLKPAIMRKAVACHWTHNAINLPMHMHCLSCLAHPSQALLAESL